MYEYTAYSKWTGIWGGWGSEGDLAKVLNRFADEGWRLIKTERAWFAWLWWLPRPKVLLIFERQRAGGPALGQAQVPQVQRAPRTEVTTGAPPSAPPGASPLTTAAPRQPGPFD